MRRKTFITIFVVLAVLIGLGAGMRGDGGRVTRWLAALHGR